MHIGGLPTSRNQKPNPQSLNPRPKRLTGPLISPPPGHCEDPVRGCDLRKVSSSFRFRKKRPRCKRVEDLGSPNTRPPNIILFMGTPKEVTPNFGKAPFIPRGFSEIDGTFFVTEILEHPYHHSFWTFGLCEFFEGTCGLQGIPCQSWN